MSPLSSVSISSSISSSRAGWGAAYCHHVVRQPLIFGFIWSVQQDEEEVESGEQSGAHLQVLPHTLVAAAPQEENKGSRRTRSQERGVEGGADL